MAKQYITKEKVFIAASHIASLGVMPTTKNIREKLKGQGSETTIHKYLKDWKHYYLKLAATSKTQLDKEQGEVLLTQIKELRLALDQTDAQSKILSQELAKTERLKLELMGKCTNLEDKNNRLESENNALVKAKDKYQSLYAEIKAEREVNLNKILEDKNTLIESLRRELTMINKTSVDNIREISFGINDSLIQEKVKAINLQDKVAVLTKKVADLTLELQASRRSLDA